MSIDVAPGTIQLWSDIGCPWAHLAVERLQRARHRLGLDGDLTIDHRAFPLELFNDRPTPKRILDLEFAALDAIEPEYCFQPWQSEPWTWPVTMLPALEAVQAAKLQSLVAAEQLDLALRRAFRCQNQCVSMRHVILEAAAGCDAVDVEILTSALDAGIARAVVVEHWRAAPDLGVRGSPHLFLSDGTDAHNPGITMHWEGEPGSKRPVIDADDAGVYDDLARRSV